MTTAHITAYTISSSLGRHRVTVKLFHPLQKSWPNYANFRQSCDANHGRMVVSRTHQSISEQRMGQKVKQLSLYLFGHQVCAKCHFCLNSFPINYAGRLTFTHVIQVISKKASLHILIVDLPIVWLSSEMIFSKFSWDFDFLWPLIRMTFQIRYIISRQSAHVYARVKNASSMRPGSHHCPVNN